MADGGRRALNRRRTGCGAAAGWGKAELIRLRREPLVEVGLLRGSKLDAVVDAVDGFGERALGGVDFVGVEEAGDVVALLGTLQKEPVAATTRTPELVVNCAWTLSQLLRM